jgi:hypothetical protein
MSPKYTKKSIEECLLSTQKRIIKKRHKRTKKSNEIIELNIIIRDRLDHKSKSAHRSLA